MQLQKTDRARAELQPGVRTLGQRERTLLLLADGVKATHDFRSLFNGDGEKIALRLLSEGFLEARPGQVTFAAPAPHSSTLSTLSTFSPVPTRVPAPAIRLAVEHPQDLQGAESLPPARTASDQFEGKRSLATTRMFLFDICERMFARRDPALASRFRDDLRGAKDRETMLAAARVMIAEIEKVAGHERADSISERIAMLLPNDTADTAA